VFSTTFGFTSRHPMNNASANNGIPNTTTRKSVLCQKYGEDCQPPTANPTITNARNANPM
jgi:hypothetical protein